MHACHTPHAPQTHTAKGWEEVGGDWLGTCHSMNVGSSHGCAQEKEEAIPTARKQASPGSWVYLLQEQGEGTALDIDSVGQKREDGVY